MTKIRLAIAVAAALTTSAALAPPAQADTVTGIATTYGTLHRGGVSGNGTVYIASSVQIARNAAGQVTNVRGAGRITKVDKVAAVQVDRVALGTSTTGVTANPVPANAGAGSTVLSVTDWVRVRPGTCTNYRVRTNYSVRWSDGGRSTFSILSPFSRICGPALPKPPTTPTPPGNPGDAVNCTDFATWSAANAWFQRYRPFYGDVAKLDGNDDGIPCESLPGAP